MCPRSHSTGRGPTLQASLTHRFPTPDLRARPLPFHSRGPFSGKGRVRAVGARACFPAPRLPLPRVPASKAGALEAAAEGPAAQVAHKEGRGGGGDRSGRRHRKGPAPSCQFHQRPQQLCLRQGEAATLENKNPKGGTSLAALEDCWAPTPLQGPPGATARGWETLGPGPAASIGAHWLPCASPTVDGRSLGREGSRSPVSWGGIQRPGSRTGRWGGCPGVGRAPAILTQLLGEDLLEGHLAPVLQVLLHDAADAGRQGGW